MSKILEYRPFFSGSGVSGTGFSGVLGVRVGRNTLSEPLNTIRNLLKKHLDYQKSNEPMKILLDNQLNGMDRYLRIQGYDVVTAYDLGYTQKTDEEVIKYAKEHNIVLVTEDNKAADLADTLDVPVIHLDMKMKSKAVAEELKKRV